MAFAREVADRVFFMDGGAFIEEGTAADLIDNPRQERTKAFLRKLSGDLSNTGGSSR
jgi:polar amino acid transport system ATP-binding protein